MKIAKIIIHEDYCVGNENIHDIALVKLKEKVDVSIHTPACLPPKDADYSGKLASVYGWGDTQTPQTHPDAPLNDEGCPGSNDLSQVLMQTTETIMTNSACEQSSGKQLHCEDGVFTETNESMKGLVTDDMVCGAVTGGQSGCFGDSGGPFTVEEGGQHTLVGAVSWGIACGVVSIIAMDLYLEKLYKIYIFYRIAFLQFIAVCLPRGTGLTRLSKTMEEQNFAKHKFCIVELKNSVCFFVGKSPKPAS